MKKLVFLAVVMISYLSFGAYLKDIPTTVNQPDGTKLECYATGDEFFNRLHDENNFTIIQGKDGWFYYGVRSNDSVIPSSYRVGEVDPKLTGLEKNAVISESLYRQKVERFNSYSKTKDAPTTGTINNLVIFVRFADETGDIFNRERSHYDDYFNKEEGPSLNHYYNEVSYNQLEVNSTYYPHVDDFSTNLSYQDIYNRSYYQPYNATTNPDGYQNDSQSTTREHDLLERAVNAIASEVPEGLDIDGDNDGNVDNIVFLISGAPGAWASLLWPHRWALYTRNVMLNRKRVFDYNFDLTGTTTYFTVGVICHEFFHTLGAPDLYHYYDNTAPDAVGAWDIMNSTSNPPQYMGAWMKYKYGDWIPEIPLISELGTYTLNPLQSETGNVYRINSPNSVNEFFVVEYRKQTGLYEQQLPGTEDGVLIYRINSAYDGNANGPPDEVYIYRPNGTLDASGQLSNAIFSQGLSRTEFNQSSNPTPFLSNGNQGGINIINIGEAGETISFDIALNVNAPRTPVAALGYGHVELNWIEPEPVSGASVTGYNVYKDGELLAENITGTSYQDTQVINGETYVYTVSADYTGDVTGESATSESVSITFVPPHAAPYQNDFSAASGMEEIDVDTETVWNSSNSSSAGGTSPEMKAYKEQQEPATSYYVTPAVSTTGIDTLLISFKHKYLAYVGSDINYSVVISGNKSDWTSVGWDNTGTENVNSETVEIVLTEFPDPLYVGWKIDGVIWNTDGWYIDDIEIRKKGTTSITDGNFPSTTSLEGNYPNPFNPNTRIRFNLSENTKVSLNIYDIKGSLVRSLISENMNKGSYNVNWDGKDNSGKLLSTGVYYINMKTSKNEFIHRSLMLK